LRIDLAFSLDDFTVETTVEVWIVLRSMIMILTIRGLMPIPLVERSVVGILWVLITVDRVSIECISKRV